MIHNDGVLCIQSKTGDLSETIYSSGNNNSGGLSIHKIKKINPPKPLTRICKFIWRLIYELLLGNDDSLIVRSMEDCHLKTITREMGIYF